MNNFIITQKSGLTRAYFTTMDWQMPLPTIQEIIDNPNNYIDLMRHIALNHKGLNWKFYKYQLNAKTYPVFMFAFAWCSRDLNPTTSYSWQIQHNANKLYSFIQKNHIALISQEDFLIKTCQGFTHWYKYAIERKQLLSGIINDLNNYYADFN